MGDSERTYAFVEMDDELDTEVGVEELRDAFRLFDKDNNGFISAKELGECIERLGETASPAEIEAIIASVNVDGAVDKITFDQFVTVLTGAPTPTPLEPDDSQRDNHTVSNYQETDPEQEPPMDPQEALQVAAAIEASLQPPPTDDSKFKPLSVEEKHLLRKMLALPSDKEAGPPLDKKPRSQQRAQKSPVAISPQSAQSRLSIETQRKGKSAKGKKAQSSSASMAASRQQPSGAFSKAARSPSKTPSAPVQPASQAGSASMTKELSGIRQLCTTIRSEMSQMEANLAVSTAERRQGHRTMHWMVLISMGCNVLLLLMVSGLYLGGDGSATER